MAKVHVTITFEIERPGSFWRAAERAESDVEPLIKQIQAMVGEKLAERVNAKFADRKEAAQWKA